MFIECLHGNWCMCFRVQMLQDIKERLAEVVIFCNKVQSSQLIRQRAEFSSGGNQPSSTYNIVSHNYTWAPTLQLRMCDTVRNLQPATQWMNEECCMHTVYKWQKSSCENTQLVLRLTICQIQSYKFTCKWSTAVDEPACVPARQPLYYIACSLEHLWQELTGGKLLAIC